MPRSWLGGLRPNPQYATSGSAYRYIPSTVKTVLWFNRIYHVSATGNHTWRKKEISLWDLTISNSPCIIWIQFLFWRFRSPRCVAKDLVPGWPECAYSRWDSYSIVKSQQLTSLSWARLYWTVYPVPWHVYPGGIRYTSYYCAFLQTWEITWFCLGGWRLQSGSLGQWMFGHWAGEEGIFLDRALQGCVVGSAGVCGVVPEVGVNWRGGVDYVSARCLGYRESLSACDFGIEGRSEVKY
jgi:hypothetical protein